MLVILTKSSLLGLVGGDRWVFAEDMLSRCETLFQTQVCLFNCGSISSDGSVIVPKPSKLLPHELP